MRRGGLSGFTLVELLIVIAIIAVLVMLLTPAVQQVRESMLRTQCKNNLWQIGRAVSQHVDKWGFFPTGGWGWGWAGDPNQGFTGNQPGGWAYNILPYIELGNLHDQGMGLSGEALKQAITATTSTPIAVYHCPTRRRAIPYPYIHPSPYYNCTYLPSGGNGGQVIGRTDYAINGGDVPLPWSKGPSTLAAGLSPTYDWRTAPSSSGVTYVRSETKPAHISDGLSYTYLVGERYVNPDGMFSGAPHEDDQGWNLGYDWDTVRWASEIPRRDRPGYTNGLIFGSAHAVGFNMVFCDGAVRTIRFNIDPALHRVLASRNDRTPVDITQLDY
jgi:prepilin-type N-terminal cleavage/methylation domain-containing protein